MELELKRGFLCDEYTIGKLYIDGIYFSDTLEDKVRDANKNGKFDNGEVKIFGETAIPYGRYEVIVTMSPKFKKELPRLVNVNSFDGILIHGVLPNAIARPKHTHGCILVGKNSVKGGLTESSDYTSRITKIIKDSKDKVYITIK